MASGKSPWRKSAIALMVACLLFSSGCALLWLGAGGAGGYLIRKGEADAESEKKKQSSGSGERAVY